MLSPQPPPPRAWLPPDKGNDPAYDDWVLAQQADRLRIATATQAAEDAAAERRVQQLEAAAAAARNAVAAKQREREKAAKAEIQFQRELQEALAQSAAEEAERATAPKPPTWVLKGWVKSTKPCRMGDKCHFKQDCVFVHPGDATEEPERAPRTQAKRTKSKTPCRHWPNCTYGKHCLFAHPDALPPPAAAAPMEPTNATDQGASPDNGGNECVVCMQREPDHLALSCWHMVLCGSCAQTQTECVLCKTPTLFQRIYR